MASNADQEGKPRRCRQPLPTHMHHLVMSYATWSNKWESKWER